MLIVRWASGLRVQYNRANFCQYLAGNVSCALYEKKDGVGWIATIMGGGFAVEGTEACSATLRDSADQLELERFRALVTRQQATIRRLKEGKK